MAALLALMPRVAVTISDPVDPEQPFSSSVTIANSGYIPLIVDHYLGVIKIESTTAELASAGPCYALARYGKWTSHRLGLDDKFSFALNEITYTLPNTLETADIAIIVKYRIPMIGWGGPSKVFGYAAHKQSNGRFYWYPDTVNIPDCETYKKSR